MREASFKSNAVKATLDRLLPAMQADGGGVELVSINEDVVNVRLIGTCVGCPSKDLTLKLGIERSLRAEFSWVQEVIRVE